MAAHSDFNCDQKMANNVISAKKSRLATFSENNSISTFNGFSSPSGPYGGAPHTG
jgi:hypothetical protein